MIKYVLIGGSEGDVGRFIAEQGVDRLEVIHGKRSDRLFGISAPKAEVVFHHSFRDLPKSERSAILDRIRFMRAVGYLPRAA